MSVSGLLPTFHKLLPFNQPLSFRPHMPSPVVDTSCPELRLCTGNRDPSSFLLLPASHYVVPLSPCIRIPKPFLRCLRLNVVSLKTEREQLFKNSALKPRPLFSVILSFREYFYVLCLCVCDLRVLESGGVAVRRQLYMSRLSPSTFTYVRV